MTWTGKYVHSNETDVTYVKPDTLSASPSWAADVVTETATASYLRQRSYAGLADGVTYIIFKQAGGSPAATDVALGEVYPQDLAAIKAKTDLIGTGTAFVGPPVSETGTLDRIVIGDDYNSANSRSFEWTFAAIPGFTVGTCTGKFGVRHSTSPLLYNFLVNATSITDIGGGLWKAVFDVDKTDTATLPVSKYDYSVEISSGGDLVTIAKNQDTRDRVLLVAKQT